MNKDDNNPGETGRFSDFVRKLDAKIAEHGHTTIWVGPDETAPAFTYSVGLTECGWPELICMNLGPGSGIEIVNSVISKLRSTETKPQHAMVVTEALNVPVHIIEISQMLVDNYFLASAARVSRIGRPELAVRGLQIVWPDTSGKFPWDVGYDSQNFPQEMLGRAPKPSTSADGSH